MIYDLVVIGGGAAGISAAIYAKRSGMNVLVLEKQMPGGVIAITESVENYLGFPSISGVDLATNFFEHLKALKIDYKLTEVINILINNKDQKEIITASETILAKKIIVATGRKPKLLELSNSKELVGKGVSTCAKCDAMFFKGKDVAVIGGGNSAVEESLYLAKIANKVYLIHRRSDFRADKETVNKLKAIRNIEVIYDSNVTKINSEDNRVVSIILNKEKELFVSGVFMYIGHTPSTDFLKGLDVLEQEGYVQVDENFETKIKGLYACGDVVRKKYYQLIIAASEGAIAALNAAK